MEEVVNLFKTEILALCFKSIEKYQDLLALGLSDEDIEDFIDIFSEVAKYCGVNGIAIEKESVVGNIKDYYWGKRLEDGSVRHMKLSEQEIPTRRIRNSTESRREAEEIKSDTPEDLVKSAIAVITESVEKILIKQNESAAEELASRSDEMFIPIEEVTKEKATEKTRNILNNTAKVFKNYLIDVYMHGEPDRTWDRKEKRLVRLL